MNLAACDEFVEAHRSGRKSAAKAAVRAFIASFASFEEKQAWVRVFLQAHDPETTIRHEIDETLVRPVLLKGYHASDVWSTRWLAATSRKLDSAGVWTVFLNEFEEKLGIYRQRLLEEAGGAR